LSRGERQRRFLSGARIRVFLPAGTSETDRLSSRSTADRVTGLRPITIHRVVWVPDRSRTVRAVWNAVGGRCYSQLPASVDSYLGASLCFGRCPVGLPARPRNLASYRPRMLTPLVVRAAHWRSLNQDVPTSDVPCRLAGTTRRLQAVSPLPLHALLVLRQGDRMPRIHLFGQNNLAPTP